MVTAAAAGMSPATPLFTQLRSYPRNAGEAEGAKRVLWGVLGRVADAVHQVFKRLAAMKVGVQAPCSHEGRCFRWCVCWKGGYCPPAEKSRKFKGTSVCDVGGGGGKWVFTT